VGSNNYYIVSAIVNDQQRKKALFFIILLGIVSLLSDITYEGARSITGQYLAVLGASGTAVGTIAGLGEFIGYSFRLLSGYLSDRTGKYWMMILGGYAMNLLAVPLLAFTTTWQMAALLIILERLGKGIRTPSRDALLSYAVQHTGRGWGFGLHQAMDQTGAVIGPLLVTFLLYFQIGYRTSFAVLAIPAVFTLCVLIISKMLFPTPQDLEFKLPPLILENAAKKYWVYLLAISFVALGYVDFALIAYHFEKVGKIPVAWIPILYAIAMAADGAAGLIFGKFYDQKGIIVLIILTALTAFFVILVFFDGFYAAFFGILLWGIGMGAHDSIMKAVVAGLVPIEKRGTAYGMFNMWFGTAWFLGSAFMGYLYDISLIGLVIFSLAAQLMAVPLLFYFKSIK